MEVVAELDDDAAEAAALEAAMAMSMGGEALTSPPATEAANATTTASLPGDAHILFAFFLFLKYTFFTLRFSSLHLLPFKFSPSITF